MTAKAWQPEQNNHNRTTGHKSQCRTELSGQENRNRMARRGQPGKESQERTTEQVSYNNQKRQPEQKRQNMTGNLGQDCQDTLSCQD
jgi:hypothetical protein